MWLFYMFTVSSDWAKVLKHSLPSPPFLLRQVSCKLSGEGRSECCFNRPLQPAFSPFSWVACLGREGMTCSSQVRFVAFQCMFEIVLIAVLENELWFQGRKKHFRSKEPVLPPSPAVARLTVAPFVAFLPVFLLPGATCSTGSGDM